MTAGDEDPAAELERWETSGGHWRVLDRSEGTVVVGLFTCDGGEEMGRVTASSADLDRVLAGRARSDEDFG